MSTTATPITSPGLWEKIKAFTTKEEQLVLHLLGAAASDVQTIQTAVEASPLAQAAVAAATQHGIPVAELGTDVTAAIAGAQKLISDMAAPVAAPTAPTPPPAAA
jgi:hypothetical protein